MEKPEWCGYQSAKNFEDTFIHFDRIHERDWRMDGGHRMMAQATHAYA